MAVTVEDAAHYIGCDPEESLLPGFFDQAVARVDRHLRYQQVGAVPTSVRDGAILEVTSALWLRRNSPGGVLQWSGDSQAVRLARDVMAGVKADLAPFRGLGATG